MNLSREHLSAILKQARSLRAMPPPQGWDGLYRVISADPPWLFKDTGTRLAPSYSGPQRPGSIAPYKQMKTEAICALRGYVRAIAHPDSFLFLWCPGALVIDGTATLVAREWGFEPKQEIIWVKLDKSGKPRIGGGHYTRLVTESLLVCRRGKARVKVHNETNLIMAQRPPYHSSKPDEAYHKIERLADGPYIELFARRVFAPHWAVWGNEVGFPSI